MNFLFELEDKKWLPHYLREMQLNYIGWLVKAFKIYEPIDEILAQQLQSPVSAICDMASGNGGPIQFLAQKEQLNNCHFILTDNFPNHSQVFQKNVSYHPNSVDLLKDVAPRADFYTIFNAFHHFNQDEKKQLVDQYKKTGLMIVEIIEPTLFHFIKILITTTLGQLLLTPFIRPFKWKQLFFTYVIPINLLTITWDGLVSVLRSTKFTKEIYDIEKYLPQNFEITSHQVGPFWAKINCIIIKEKDEKLV